MSTNYNVPAQAKPDRFTDEVSLNDAKLYKFDFTPWQEDNADITSVTWTVETGNAAVSSESETNGVAQALVTFNESGVQLITVLADTGSQKKKVWLEVRVHDYKYPDNDYGLFSGYC